MKLRQGQIWKTERRFLRIVSLERLAVAYKSMADLDGSESAHHNVTKKAFCRLIKSGELLQPDGSAAS